MMVAASVSEAKFMEVLDEIIEECYVAGFTPDDDEADVDEIVFEKAVNRVLKRYHIEPTSEDGEALYSLALEQVEGYK